MTTIESSTASRPVRLPNRNYGRTSFVGSPIFFIFLVQGRETSKGPTCMVNMVDNYGTFIAKYVGCKREETVQKR